jgi:hypothetical protein
MKPNVTILGRILPIPAADIRATAPCPTLSALILIVGNGRQYKFYLNWGVNSLDISFVEFFLVCILKNFCPFFANMSKKADSRVARHLSTEIDEMRPLGGLA